MCTNIQRPLRFSSSLRLSKGTPRVPGRESNPGTTKWQAGALTIELRLTPKIVRFYKSILYLEE